MKAYDDYMGICALVDKEPSPLKVKELKNGPRGGTALEVNELYP